MNKRHEDEGSTSEEVGNEDVSHKSGRKQQHSSECMLEVVERAFRRRRRGEMSWR